MKPDWIVVAVTLLMGSAAAAAPEVLVLANGRQMEVETWSVEGGVVTFRTLEGRLGSLQTAMVDLEATRAANAPTGSDPGGEPAPEPAEPSTPAPPPPPDPAPVAPAPDAAAGRAPAADPESLARDILTRLNVEAIIEGLPELAAPMLSGIDEPMRGDAARGVGAWTEALEVGAAWDEAVRRMAGEDPEHLAAWAAWVRSRPIASLLRMEAVEADPDERAAWLEAHEPLPQPRQAVLRRLSAHLNAPEVQLEPILGMYQAVFRGFQAGVPGLFRNEDAGRGALAGLRGQMENARSGEERRMHYRYRDASDEDLQAYAGYWETDAGAALRRVVAGVMEASLEVFGQQAGERLAAAAVIPQPLADVALSDAGSRFEAPGEPWVGWAVGPSFRNVKAAYWHREWDVLVLVMAEDTGAAIDAAGLDEYVRSDSEGAGWQAVDVRDRVVGSVPGRLYQDQQPGRGLWRLRWIASHGQRVYQLQAVSSAGLGAGPARELAARCFERLALDLPAAAPAEPVVFEELNFRFAPPAAPWVRWSVEKVNADATLGFLRSRPAAWFVVIAESGFPVAGEDPAVLADIVKANMSSAAESYEITSEQPWEVAGVGGYLIESDVVVDGQALRYVQWAYLRNGFAYQLHLHTRRDSYEAAALREMALEIFEGFSLLDPDRSSLAVAEAPDALEALESARYGYRVDLRGLGWRSWEDLDEKFPRAEVGGLLGEDAAFGIVPVVTPGLTPAPEAAAAGVLAALDVPAGDAALRPRGEATPERRDFDYEREVNGQPFEYRLSVRRGGELVCLVATWRAAGSEVSLEDLDAVLDAVELDAGAALPDDLRVLPPRERATHVEALNQMGLHYFRLEQWLEAADFFRAAYEIEGNDAVVLTNYAGAITYAERFGEALEYLEPRLGAFPGELELLSYRPFLLWQLGRPEEALPLYGDLFARGHRNENDLDDYARLLWKADRRDEALEVVRRFRAAGDSNDVARLEARLHRWAGDHAGAAQVLEQRIAATAFDAGLVDALLETWQGAARYRDVVDRVESLRESGYSSAGLYLQQARAELGLERPAAAKRLLESAAALEPGNDEVADYLARVSGMLGEGDNARLRQAIPPVEIPAALRRSPDVDPARLPGSGAFLLYRVGAISFRSGVEHRSTERLAVRVLDPGAVDSWGALTLRFDPLYERIYVNTLRVLDARGEVRSTGRVEDYYVTDANEHDGDDDQLVNLPVAGLEPGFTLELVYTRQTLSPPVRMPYERRGLFGGDPAASRSLFVTGDVDRIRAHRVRVPEPQRGEGWLFWSLDDPPAVESESRMAPLDSFLPYVWLADRDTTWEQVAGDYLGYIGERLAPSDVVTRTAQELTAGLERPEERIQALADFAQRSLTYRSIVFGRRALMPNPVSRILGNRYGDCKDHALLLYHLLQAAGIPARLALVSVSHPVRPEVPALAQFDHMIVHLPEAEGGLSFVDATDKGYDVASLSPLGLAEDLALVLDPDAPRLVEIPAYTPERHGLRLERSLQAQGSDLIVDEIVTADGYQASSLRWALQGRSAQEQLAAIRTRLAGSGDLHLHSLEVEDLDASSRPLRLRLRYTVAGALPLAGDRLVGRLPALWERDQLATDPSPRRTPFAHRYPLGLSSSITFEAPDGARLLEPLDTDDSGSGRFTAWRLSVRRAGPKADLRFEMERPTLRGTPDDFAELGRDTRAALAALERVVVVSSEAGEP